MAYGVTSTTLLLTVGIAPAAASASVHLAEVGTTLASGVSHWRFGNVDWRKVGWLAVPGGMGAFVGSVVLSSTSAEAAEPIVASFLFGLGVYILIRFAFNRASRLINDRPIPRRFLSPLGLAAGFLDAAGGGGGVPSLRRRCSLRGEWSRARWSARLTPVRLSSPSPPAPVSCSP